MLRKAAIIAAGKGTRLFPLTLGIPKELLLVGKQPVIFYSFDQIKSANIYNVQVVTGWKKGVIQDTLGSGRLHNLKISYAYQDQPRGLGHAILQVKDFAGSDDIAILLGDNIIHPQDILSKLWEFHDSKKSKATLLVKEIENPEAFGVVNISETGKILEIFEKPKGDEKKPFKQENGKYLSIVGVYIFSSDIFDWIETTKPSRNNEIQITDTIKEMVVHGLDCYALKTSAEFRDIGTFKSLFEAQKDLMSAMNIENESELWIEMQEKHNSS